MNRFSESLERELDKISEASELTDLTEMPFEYDDYPSTQERVVLLDGEAFPDSNTCVVMAGVSECQNKRVFDLLVPLEGISINLTVNSWHVTVNQNTGNRVIEFTDGRKVDLGYYERKYGLLDSPEAADDIYRAILGDVRSKFLHCLKDISAKRDPEAKKMVNTLITITGDSISQLETVTRLVDKRDTAYKLILIYVVPDTAVLKHECRKRLVFDGYSELRKQIIDINNTIFELRNRRDLLESLEEIWVINPHCIADTDDDKYVENTDIYRIKKTTESMPRMGEVEELLDAQIFICQNDGYFNGQLDVVKVYGGKSMR